MLPRQRVKTVTDVVELPNFVQDSKERKLQMADLVQGT